MAADLERLARAQRRALLDVDGRLASDLVDAYSSAWQRLRPQVDDLAARIQAARDAGEEVSLGWLAREDRLRELERRIVAEVGQIAQSANGAITTAQHQVIGLAQQHASAAVTEALGPPPAGAFFSFNQLHPEAVRALVGDLAEGKPLAALLDALGPEAAQSVKAALTDGVVLGHGPAQIARAARAAFGGNAVRATTVARTELIRAYKNATLASYRANSDVVKGWRWISSLGPRSCAACVSKHGSEHPLTETFHDHPRGRCAASPIVRSWAELGFDVPEATPVAVQTGEDWFAAQDADVQRRILSPAKMAAYDAGDIALADLAGAQRSRAWGKTLVERSLTDAVGAERTRELIREARTG